MNDAVFMHDIEGLSTNTTLFVKIQNDAHIFQGIEPDELSVLAEEYYIRSSRKRLSPLCRKWVNDAVDLNAFLNKVASALIVRFGTNWASVFNAYFMTNYKPLENYAMKEVELPNITDETTINTQTELKNEQKSKVYGFNSDTAVNDSESETVTTGDPDKNETVSKTNRRGVRTLERTGNIGVTTSQQMLESEIALRKLDFWNSVFNDIDRLLCFIFEAC